MNVRFDLQRFAVITHSGNTAMVMGYVSDDSITTDGNNVTVYASGGNDYIYNNRGNNVRMYGEDGKDSLHNYMGNNLIADAGAGDDYFNSYKASNVSVNGGKGNDYLQDTQGTTVTLLGGAGNDTLFSSGSKGRLNGGDGNDIVTNYGGSALIDGGNDNDLISNDHASKVTMSGGTGNDTLWNWSSVNSLPAGANVSMVGGAGNDTIWNSGEKVTIDGGAGKDTVTNYGVSALIDGGADNDLISNDHASKVTMSGGTGNDTLWNWSSVNSLPAGANVSMVGGAGNDTIWNSGEKVTINGGSGNDTINLNSAASNNLIVYNEGDGNDVIQGINSTSTLQIGDGTGSYSSVKSGSDIVVTVGEGKVTLKGASGTNFTILGKKPDSTPKNITNSSNNTLLTGSTLNDTITSSGNNVTIQANNGNDLITLQWTTAVTSNTVTVDAGDGADSINASGNYISLVAGNGNDSIYAHGSNQTIFAGDGNDTISGNHGINDLFGGAGNDVIDITTYWNNTLRGGAGNDTLAVQGGNYHSIISGAGDDKISLGSAANSTIFYANGDGNDTVWGFNSTDVLSINGSYTAPKKSGKDVILTVGNGKIIFKDAADLGTITINGKTHKVNPNPLIVTPQDVIKTFMTTLNEYNNSSAKIALDNAVKAASNGNYKTIDEATTAMVNDCKYSATGTEFLKNYCGIIIGNDDTGAIIGSDAGGSKTKTAKSIIPESGQKKSLDLNQYGGFTTWYDNKFSGLTVWYNDVGEVTSDKQQIMDCVYTWWMSGALYLIDKSYGYSFNDSNAKYTDLRLKFTNEDTNYLAYTTIANNALEIVVNLKYYNNFKSNDYDGVSPFNQTYLDRVIAHETVHAIMMSKYNNFGSLPQFITEGTAELIHGIDDVRTSYIENLASNSGYLNSKLKNMSNGTGDSTTYAAGYMFLRWLAKQCATSDDSISSSAITPTQKKLPTGVTLKNTTITVSTKFKGSHLNLNDYNTSIQKIDASAFTKAIEIFGNKNDNAILGGTSTDYLAGGAGNDTLNGGAGNDILSGGTGNDSLNGGDGNDTLYSGTSTNTLTGGAGKDIFFYEGGKLLITDFTASDKLKIAGNKISKSEVKNNDVILTTSGGSITIAGGMGKNITLIDKDDKQSSNIYGKTLKVTKSPVTLGSAYVSADASSMKVSVTITGNTLDNSILGGAKNDIIYGEAGADILFGKAGNDSLFGDAGNDILKGDAGNDSLWGGAGNDSLFGGDGNDTFIYTANTGTDTIFDYSNGDMLQILDAKGAKGSFTKGVFSNNDLTLSVKGGGTIIFDDVSNSTIFNINGTNYKISGSKLVKK